MPVVRITMLELQYIWWRKQARTITKTLNIARCRHQNFHIFSFFYTLIEQRNDVINVQNSSGETSHRRVVVLQFFGLSWCYISMVYKSVYQTKIWYHRIYENVPAKSCRCIAVRKIVFFEFYSKCLFDSFQTCQIFFLEN